MQPDDQNVIEVENLSRLFGSFRAVDNISFSVRRGEVFGFLGANGAGKTTTIKILCGLLAPSSGSGRVLQYDIMKQCEKIKPKVGYMSQKFSLYPDLTVLENLDFYGGLYRIKKKTLAIRKQWALKMAGLTTKKNVITSNLSGGWKQRLALGAALLHEPELLFLDEPTAGVSPEARRDFWDLIHELSAGGTTVFVTSHYMDEVEHCDRIVLMSRGTIAALDSPEGLKKNALDGDLITFDSSASLDLLRQVLMTDKCVHDVQAVGVNFRVQIDADSHRVDYLISLAKKTDLELKNIQQVEPTLEDVFISVIGKVER